MPDNFEIRIEGIEKLEKLGRDLKEAGDKELRREMLKTGQAIGKPVKENIRKHALSDLPRKGGLNVWVAKNAKTQTQVRLSGRNLGVRFRTKFKGSSDVAAINAGEVRHPLFGNKDHWYATKVTPGFAYRALDELAPEVRKQFLALVDDIAAKLEAKG